MPLKRKLLIYLAAPALLLAALGFVSITALLRLQGAAGEILSDNYRTIQSARAMEQALWLLEESSAGEARARHAAAFESALDECERNITEPGERPLLRGIRREWNTARLRLLARATPGPGARERIALLSPLYKQVGDLIALNEDAMFRHERRTRSTARLMVGAASVCLAVAMAALVVFALVAANRISGPILSVAGDLHSALKPAETGEPEAGQPVDEILRLRKELDDLLDRLSSYEDEQARKFTRLQARLAFVIEEVAEGLALLDTDLNILGMNRTGRELLNAGREGGSLNLFHDGLPESARAALLPAMNPGAQTEASLPEMTLRRDGEDKTYSPRLLPFKSPEGDTEGYLLIFWDVTEQKQFEESRRKFVSMFSHQLKTPVTSLTMSVNLINESFKGRDEETDDLLRMLKADCATLSGLVTELIEAARDAAPTLMLRRLRIDLSGLLNAALKPLAAQARDKGIEWKQSMPSAPVFADADPVKFPWVVTNIVGNALRYTRPGGTVSLALEKIHDRAVITITDTGAGIAREDLKRLFLPFTSLDKIREPGSLGLGLTIAKEIVDAHRGEIRVNSQIGKGTEFIIEIPLPGESGQ